MLQISKQKRTALPFGVCFVNESLTALERETGEKKSTKADIGKKDNGDIKKKEKYKKVRK